MNSTRPRGTLSLIAKPKKRPGTSARYIQSMEDQRNFVTSFARGLDVIQSFNNEPQGITPSQVAKKTGLSRAAVRRFLLTLEMLEYVEHIGGAYHLRPSVLRLGCSYLSSSTLPALAQPILEEVSERVRESTSLSALDGDNIIYLARHTSARVLSVGLSIGSRLPAYCTSMGRVLLANLPKNRLEAYMERTTFKKWTTKTVTSQKALMNILAQVATDNYCIVDGELEPGLRSIAAPIRTSSGRVVAAMNVGAHVSTVTLEDMKKRILPVLREHAEMSEGFICLYNIFVCKYLKTWYLKIPPNVPPPDHS